MNRLCLWLLPIVLVSPVLAQQDTESTVSEELLTRPTEAGLRFTPEMARAMAGLFIREAASRYELPEDRRGEATDAVARRLMEAAHSFDTSECQQRAEGMVADVMNAIVDQERSKRRSMGIPPKLGEAVAKGIAPSLPEVRKLVRNVGQDLTPMLPFKQQLKLAADLVTAGAAIDYFEQTMKRWSEGDVAPFDDPFNPPNKTGPVELGDDGQSKGLKDARKSAEGALEARAVSEWEKYVSEAKGFYGLDEAQGATADSALREAIERAEAITKDQTWRSRAYDNRFWNHMLWRLRMGWRNPLREHVDREWETINAPVREIETELKKRIDDIPTSAQRQAAQERILTALKAQGFDPEILSEEGEDESKEQDAEPNVHDSNDDAGGDAGAGSDG